MQNEIDTKFTKGNFDLTQWPTIVHDLQWLQNLSKFLQLSKTTLMFGILAAITIWKVSAKNCALSILFVFEKRATCKPDKLCFNPCLGNVLSKNNRIRLLIGFPHLFLFISGVGDARRY